MRIEQNKSFMIGDNSQNERLGNLNNQKKNKNGTIFAGNLNKEEDPIIKKKKEAQQKAMKVVSDTFAGEQKMDAEVNKMSDNVEKLRGDIKSAKDELSDIEQQKASIKDTYQIEDDSQEQKDLELLEKRRQGESGKALNILSKEEKQRLAEIDKAGLTDYQKRSLELSASVDPIREKMDNSKLEMKAEIAAITGVKLERLKSSPLVTAGKEADAIVDAASDEIMGMIVQDAKEHMDEEEKKREEEAEKLAEEETKKQEFVDGVKEKIEELEELVNPEEQEESKEQIELEEMTVEELLDVGEKKSNAQMEIEKIAQKMNLIVEDIKGAVVDSKL